MKNTKRLMDGPWLPNPVNIRGKVSRASDVKSRRDNLSIALVMLAAFVSSIVGAISILVASM